jgi:uncharacterized protein YxjI
VHIEISDSKGNKLGSIEEKVWESLLKVSTSYVIKDSSGKEIAQSDKISLFSTNVEIRDNSGKVIATFYKPALNIGGDNWSCKISSDSKLDRRLLLFIPAYKTAADNDREK